MNDKFANAFSNPQFLAGLAMIRGVPADQAYGQAALQLQKQEEITKAQQDNQRRQYALQQLPLIAQKIQGLPPQEAFGELVNIGVDPKEALLILESFNKQGQNKAETFTGPNNIRYQTIVNPETGEIEAHALKGQNINDQPTISREELRANVETIKNLNKDAAHSQEELRLIEESEKAIQDFYENTGSNTSSGTLISKFTPEKLDNIVYNKKAQAARQIMRKLTQGLLQNRQEAAKGAGSDFRTEQTLKGLPSFDLQPEAMKELIHNLNKQNYTRILKAKFFEEWYKNNGKNLSGAESSFANLINSTDIIDKNGKINKDLYNKIPNIVQDYANPERANMNLGQGLNNFSLEDLIAERKRRGR